MVRRACCNLGTLRAQGGWSTLLQSGGQEALTLTASVWLGADGEHLCLQERLLAVGWRVGSHP